MADVTRPALGLSIGATNLAAVTADRAVTRKPVLTLYGQRTSEVGVPSENPHLDEPGLVITDFVNRVGTPARVVAADGSTHRSEVLVADALRAIADAATEGRTLPDAVVASYPAHWQPAAVDALRGVLSADPEWLPAGPAVLMDDAAAAVIALQTNPGLPATGVVAVCDFGGSGSSLTLLDAANGFQRIATTVRHEGFSGDLIDQQLLNHVVAELSAAGSFDTSGTSAIGSITRLRGDCRRAKEQLSSSTVVTLTAVLPGFHGDIHLTRAELDDAIRQPLEGYVSVVRDSLQRNGIQAADLTAVAAVGGGANIPAVTNTLADQFRVPVITAPRPHLTAAIGAALRAAHGPAEQGATAKAATVEAVSPPAEATAVFEPPPQTSGAPALAWSEADDDTGITPLLTGEYPAQALDAEETPVRPPREVDRDAGRDRARPAAVPWYQRPLALIIGTALVLLAIAAAIILALRHSSGGAPGTPTPSVSTSAPAGTSAPESPTQSQPSDTNQPPSQTSSQTSQPSSSTETTTTPPSSSTQTTTQPSTSEVTTTQPPFQPNRPILPVFPRYPGRPEEPGVGGG